MWWILSLACADVDWGADPAKADYDADGWSGEAGDCANDDPAYNPAAADPVGDGRDTNCDGVDGVDADGDHHLSVESGGDDCADTDPDAFPGAPERWNGADDDCDGCVDDPAPTFRVHGNQLDVVIPVGDPAGFALGLSDTVSDWYGESCADGHTDCHPMGPSGGSLTVVSDTPGAGETRFDAARLEDTTWVLWASDGACTVGGLDPAVYPGCCLGDG